MLHGDHNLKDSENKSLSSYQQGMDTLSVSISYTKYNNLITALFMVTDMLDSTESIRHQLRKLAVEILSDIHQNPSKALPKVAEVLSFLNVAMTVRLISEMNARILIREFQKLQQSIESFSSDKSAWLEELLPATPMFERHDASFHSDTKNRIKQQSTRLGVQKAGALLSVLDGVKANMSDSKFNSINTKLDSSKRQRRDDILIIIKANPNGLTIKDIKDKAKGLPDKFTSIISCGDKTLQRELVAMLKDGLLKRLGDKRWTKYFLA